MRDLVVIGTNYKFSGIETRERLSLSSKRLDDFLVFLKENLKEVDSFFVLSTCNRMEIYGEVKDYNKGIEELIYFMSLYYEINRDLLLSHLYRYKDNMALRHFLAVACGLDSLIVGEKQIMGQINDAVNRAFKLGCCLYSLKILGEKVIDFAKEMHRVTRISWGKVSIGSVVVDYLKRRIGELGGKNILVLGVGDVGKIVLKYLVKYKPDIMIVANKRYKEAQILADSIDTVEVKVIKFSQLNVYLFWADIILSATASPHFVIRKKDFGKHHYKKLVMIDLAMPRDIDPQVKEIENIELYHWEELEEIIKKNKQQREKEAARVRGYIDKKSHELWEEYIVWGQEVAFLL